MVFRRNRQALHATECVDFSAIDSEAQNLLSSLKKHGNEDERKEMRKRNKCYDETSLSAGADNEVVLEGKYEVRVEMFNEICDRLVSELKYRNNFPGKRYNS